MKIINKNAILPIILLFAFIIRCFYLQAPLWYDEACSWFSANQTFPSGIFNNLKTLDLQHTPLYFIGLHFWMNLFGDSEIVLRIFSLIFGLMSIYLGFQISYKITNNKHFGYIISTILATNPLLVLFSVEVRMYSVTAFLVLLSINYLLDYNTEKNKKNLLKLLITNILIPYTYVGGILYNTTLFFCYKFYLTRNDKNKLQEYINSAKLEFCLLIPYFLLIFFYGIQRSIFVVAHEGPLKFFQIVDIIRNFFGTNICENIYWPSSQPYNITLWFTFAVIIPCVYFVYGYYKGLTKSQKFIRLLYFIPLLIFGLFIIFSFFQIYVLTVRYILYILPPVIILAALGLLKNLEKKHFYGFISAYILLCTIFSISYSFKINKLKAYAFKAVLIECNNLKLNANDMVIMPFGADAPYYFRGISTPRIFKEDFHKLVRNPYGQYYNKEQQQIMSSKNKKNDYIFNKIYEDNVFSDNFYGYFVQNVNSTLEKGRYVLLAMYGPDNYSLKPIQELRKQVKTVSDVKNNILGVMFQKYLCDIIAMLNIDFKLVKTYQKGNYTYYLYQKL